MTLDEFFAPEHTPAERAAQARFDQLDQELSEQRDRENAYVFALLDQIDNPNAGSVPEMPAHMQRRAPINSANVSTPEPVAYTYATRRREDGKIEELLHPDTPVERGDLVFHDEGIWRLMKPKPRPQPANPAPVQTLVADELDFLAAHLDAAEAEPVTAPKSPRLVVKPDAIRWDRALVACRNAEADFNEAKNQFGPTDERTVEAASKATRARDTYARVRKQYDDHPDLMRKIDAIESYRRTDEGRAAYNRDRRKVRDRPNADLSDKTDDQLREHKRAREREKKRRQRAAAKAAKAS